MEHTQGHLGTGGWDMRQLIAGLASIQVSVFLCSAASLYARSSVAVKLYRSSWRTTLSLALSKPHVRCAAADQILSGTRFITLKVEWEKHTSGGSIKHCTLKKDEWSAFNSGWSGEKRLILLPECSEEDGLHQFNTAPFFILCRLQQKKKKQQPKT